MVMGIIQSIQFGSQVMIHVGTQGISDFSLTTQIFLELIKIPCIRNDVGIDHGIGRRSNPTTRISTSVAKVLEKGHFSNKVIGCNGGNFLGLTLNVDLTLGDKVSVETRR